MRQICNGAVTKRIETRITIEDCRPTRQSRGALSWLDCPCAREAVAQRLRRGAIRESARRSPTAECTTGVVSWRRMDRCIGGGARLRPSRPWRSFTALARPTDAHTTRARPRCFVNRPLPRMLTFALDFPRARLHGRQRAETRPRGSIQETDSVASDAPRPHKS
jgi:hypothetical protein